MQTDLSPDDMALLHHVVHLHRPELVPLLDLLGRTPLPLEQRSQLWMALSCDRWKRGRRLTEPPEYRTRLIRLMRSVGMRCALDPDEIELLQVVAAHYPGAPALRFDVSGRLLLTGEERECVRDILVEERRKSPGWGKPPQPEEPTPLAARLATVEGYVWTCSPLLPEDMYLPREAVEKHRPALLPVLDRLGEVPLTKEQRNELQSGAVLTEFLANLDSRHNPNERGWRMDMFFDYVRWI
jgi:hypothetical protein